MNALVDPMVERSLIYREFLAEREEILRHKWLESEKVGADVGFEAALVNWVVHHHALVAAGTSASLCLTERRRPAKLVKRR